MAEFKAFSPHVEVKGEVVLSFVAVMGAFRRLADEILAKNGIVDPRPGKWYSQQAWLNSFKAITEEIGPKTLFVLARQIPLAAPIPPELDTLEKALFNLDRSYRETHRGGDVGHYIFYKTGERCGRVETRNPYPCDFDRGLLDALAHRLEAGNPYVDIHHHDESPCKKQGAESCLYTVSW